MLTAGGERCDKMMSNLFKRYLVEEYKYFVSYIQHQKNKHDNDDNIDKDKLMALALNKYVIDIQRCYNY